MIFDLINAGADPVKVIELYIIAFIIGFIIRGFIDKNT